MKTVVIISANGEWSVVRQLLPEGKVEATPFGECFTYQNALFFQGGWGKISAAATAQFIIDHYRPDLLVNLGTCGGFEGRIERSTVILAEKTIVYDIIEQMIDPEQAIADYTTRLDLSWLPRVLPFPVLRGLLVSGDRDIVAGDIPLLIERYQAVAADWESGAIAWVANRNSTKCLILRGVSDLVSPEGGEVYGDYETFLLRTREIMKKLLEQLPKWLEAIEKVQMGYRGY
jgi:adenosylhomocysteine nucleosidase